MMDFLRSLFSTDFLPHGACYLWNPAVLWLNVISDAVIALSYYAIPVLLFWFARKRRDLTFQWIFVAFGVFILACGTTHAMGVWTVWNPAYRLDGVVKAITALASLATAISLIPLLPVLVTLPSPTELARINRRLSTEIEERRAAEEEVRRVNSTLEQRVAERTAELEQSNLQLRQSNRELQAEMRRRQTIEEQLIQSQKMEAVGRLAGGVAHDFNNLLTGICGYNDLLVEELADQPKLQQYALEVQRAALRAAALTSQLLAFSRRQVVQPTIVNLAQALSEIENMLHRIIGEDIELRIDLSVTDAHVRMDRGQLDQVILNLAVNARDAMPGGGKLTITLSRQEPNAVISVTDTGHGMDEDTRRRLFEPFFTTKQVGKGTGLGLSIVYGIVQQNGGDIIVESEPGKGSRFTIQLPEVRDATRPEQADAEVAAHATGNETILVAEDEASVRALIREILEKHGYRMLEAASPAEAIRISEEYPGEIHLLLTDVVMPEINGAELARRLTTLRPDMKVLYMSGYSDRHLATRLVPEQGVAFIQKPFNAPRLIRKIQETMNVQTRKS